jgi:NAD(P)-dependent dehydrogenase (short-subunit alcohol dehydrogenase family)
MILCFHIMEAKLVRQEREQPPLKGTLFITGGSSGIGLELVNHFKKKYKRVKNFDVLEAKTDDVRSANELRRAMEHSLAKKPYQNDLIVCAGVFRPIRFTKQSQEDIDFALDINLKGALYTTQQFLKWHEKTNHSIKPNILIMSSISAFHHGGDKNVVYDATKAALSYMVRDLANFNCVANALEPGTIRGTRIGEWTPQFNSDETTRKLIEHGQQSDVEKMGWEVTTTDIAKVAETILSYNPYGAINGTTITVDGGQTALRERF